MCAQVVFIPQDELERIIADVENSIKAEQGINAGAYQSAFPKSKIPVAVPNMGRLEVQVMQWGYPVPWQKEVVFNTKMETALAPKQNMWSDSIRRRRCLVPTFGFYEPHRKDTHLSPKTGKPVKDKYCFSLPGSDVVWLAGVYEDEHFSVMTTTPNQWVETIHNRMPVVLRPSELGIWLYGEYASLADREKVQLECEISA
jgi:putative SOS response-associated peptidase YedK